MGDSYKVTITFKCCNNLNKLYKRGVLKCWVMVVFSVSIILIEFLESDAQINFDKAYEKKSDFQKL